MKLSILLDAIPSEYIISMHISNPEQNIHQICSLSATSYAFTDDIIYVSPISAFQEIDCSGTPSVFVLLDDLKTTNKVLPDNYILCSYFNTAGELFTLLLSRLSLSNRVMEAELAISRALFDCTSVNDLLDIAASLLKNPVLLQDFTTRLLAHSSIESMSVEDEILNSVFQIGYVTPDLFQKYDYGHVLDQIKNTPQTFLLKSSKKSDRLICRLTVNRRYFGWFLTVAYNQPFQDGDISIMNFLCGALSLFLEKENILPNMTKNENLLQELLHGVSYSEESFKTRAAGFSWKLQNHYFIVVISISINNTFSETRTIMAYKNHLSLIFPNAIIIEEKHYLILFFDTKESRTILKTLLPVLQKYELTAAYSDLFNKITDFPYLYQQILSVLSIGHKLHPKECLFAYRDYSIYCAIQKLNENGYIKYYCMPELIHVYQYDRKYGTSFSTSKRRVMELASVSLAANELGIHRNTMEYRLRKFNELSGITNYNAAIIQQLSFSYKILDLFPELIDEITT